MPHLNFSSAAWSPWTIGDIETLEKVQKRAVAMISGLAGRAYEARLKRAGHGHASGAKTPDGYAAGIQNPAGKGLSGHLTVV